MRTYFYSSGEAILPNDVVTVVNQPAIVKEIFQEKSQRAGYFSCFETGGILLHFENGDRQVWLEPDEDLELISRGKKQ